jgi:hypothetical protein
MHLFCMAQLNAQSNRAASGGAETPSSSNPPPEADLKATIALSPEALAALIDEVKKSQGDAGPTEAEEPIGAAPDERSPGEALEELTARLASAVRRPPLPRRPGAE